MSRLAKARTLAALGPGNLARVALYRAGLKSGRHPSQKLQADVPTGPFFAAPTTPAPKGSEARDDWQDGSGTFFGLEQSLIQGNSTAPDWFAPHGGVQGAGARAVSDRPWWTIPDFDPDLGDIKTVWEASRLDWALPFAQRAALGDDAALTRLNDWLADWCRANAPYLGANWKCGQEASIRVLHLAAAAHILGQADTPTPGLTALIRLHLRRIAPTMGYAIGQQNNHGTSEAGALFVGGTWLGGPEGAQWAKTGRRWLENRARVLIEPDGTFSQYSVTYHRVMLDTYAFAEVWRRARGAPSFSTKLTERLTAATHWLRQMTDAGSGDVPNIGANDGAHLLRLAPCPTRDFRPSVQLASALFGHVRAYSPGPWDQQALWLGVPVPDTPAPPLTSQSFDQGGFTVLRRGDAAVWLRYPRFRFRPSQADALHVDLWVNGVNLLRDAGSFSYNVSPADTAYFNGTGAHNTVQFDDRDQMPRLSRFLFGDWLRAMNVMATDTEAAAGYIDSKGAQHHRHIALTPGHLRVTDDIAGFESHATLRWRLPPGDWTLTGNRLTGPSLTLDITAKEAEITLSEGHESRYYLRKTPLPVLEIRTGAPGTLISDISF